MVRDELRQGVSCAVLTLDDDAPERWAASVDSFLTARIPTILLTSDPDGTSQVFGAMDVDVRTGTLAELLVALAATEGAAGAVAVATQPVVVPQELLSPAVRDILDDPRTATVSFLSNSAGYLSFPDRNVPSAFLPPGHSEQTLTDLLRAVPVGDPVVPVPVPAGSLLLVAAVALRTLGALRTDAPTVGASLVEFSLRGVRRGLRNVLDATTFVTTAFDARRREVHGDPVLRSWLTGLHIFYPTLHDQERDGDDSPLADALRLRSAAVRGLHVLVDGSCLGPYEMGTQVAVLAQIKALAAHRSVSRVVVGTRGAAVPPYARPVLSSPTVEVVDIGAMDFPGAPHVDVVHRPFQPDGPIPFDRWRAIASRIVVTVQDLIAYENGAYHATGYNWMVYRSCMKDATYAADAVVAVSHDTATSLELTRLRRLDDHVHVVENGTDHLRDRASSPTAPPVLGRDGEPERPFLVVLGAAYAHKNRDLAIRAWQLLRAEGRDVDLVLAGVVVPVGSTRDDEALAIRAGGERPVVLADVTTAERDWLLGNAAVVLYPTSAEGFGLIPFEAATFGTPSVFVAFGPLAEFLGGTPGLATEWTPAAIARATAAFLDDTELGERHIEHVLQAGAPLTWDRYADRLVRVYQEALALPRRAR